MSFSSRIFLLIVVTLGSLVALVTFFSPYDPRLPWMAEVNAQLQSGRVTGIWLLPGCIIGLFGDLPAAIWFAGCLGGWLWGAWVLGRYELVLGLGRKLAYGDGLTGWPVAMLFVFYLAFFLVRRIDLKQQAENSKRHSRIA